MKKILLPPAFFLFTISIQAQIVINEYSAANITQVLDNYGDNSDWVEGV